jgi:hypothetical protein
MFLHRPESGDVTWRNLLFTLGAGAGFFLAMYQWMTLLAEMR